jgi:anti-anti-sigma regulatory factor
MNLYTQFEDLSNEIFFEIFDHLDALDIFTAFYSLNQRLSSILQFIPLRVVISCNHFRSEVEYLSSHLTSHAHQVISLNIDDTVRDDTSIVSLLFDRHQFINLQSCVFHAIQPSTKLETVIKQLKSLDRLLSFAIYQTYNGILNGNDLVPTMLMHKSSSLRSIHLRLPYDYLGISNYSSISSNITSLYLQIFASTSTISVYSVLPILRLCHSIRHLGILLIHPDLLDEPYQK